MIEYFKKAKEWFLSLSINGKTWSIFVFVFSFITLFASFEIVRDIAVLLILLAIPYIMIRWLVSDIWG